MNYERIYEYRFRDIDQGARAAVWSEIAPHVHGLMGEPADRARPGRRARRVHLLDPRRGALGGGRGRLPRGRAGPRREIRHLEDHGRRASRGDHFDGVFVSNFLEHLHNQEEIADFLERMRAAMKPGGAIAIMGPNYRYCAGSTGTCADHWVALTHLAIAEHLYAAGFEPVRVIPRYLPYSFSGVLPPSRRLTRLYLRMPLAWRLLGKQFLVIGRS